jgi:hypothetical protein
MSTIEKYISPFISQQFPQFYRAEGPNFVAFVKAYYEWLEQSEQAVGHARTLLDYNDIDETLPQFIKYFSSQFIADLPEDVIADKRLLLKRILDLYRSKGTKRAHELLFRLVFGEDIELYLPGEYIFRPSDNTWKIPTYIEVSFNSNLPRIVGTEIQTPGRTGTAIVNSFSKRIVNGRTVNILELDGIRGKFLQGNRIYQTNGTDITFDNAPIITGSLSGIAISQGGTGYRVGDILNVTGSGIQGKAKVVSVIDEFTGAVSFQLIDGGTGYSTNAIVTVEPTVNLLIESPIGYFANQDIAVDSTTDANGTVTFSNSSFIQIIDFSPFLTFTEGSTITSPTGSATITRVSGGSGTGATFRVGGLTNREFVDVIAESFGEYLNVPIESQTNTFDISVSSVTGSFNVGHVANSTANVLQLECIYVSTNTISNGESLSNSTLGISDLYVYRSDGTHVWCTSSTDSSLNNANIASGAILTSNTSSSVIQLVVTPTKEIINGTGTVVSANSTTIRLDSNTYFVPTKTLTNITATGSATIDNVIRLTNWDLPKLSFTANSNLDTTLLAGLTFTTLEVGTIAFLSQINPGSNYVTRPYIDVIEPAIAGLNIVDSFGRIKGHNATVDSRIVGGNGVVTSVEVLNSGYGYLPGESVNLAFGNNQTIVTGTSIVYSYGKGEGRWLNRRSFASDEMRIQDSFYYQDFSYEIVAQRMLSSYEQLVRNLVHPSGKALFGRFKMQDIYTSDQSSVVLSQITATP